VKVKVNDSEIIGKRFKSNSCNSFTVTDVSNRKSGGMKTFNVVFDEVNGVRYQSSARKEDILKGRVNNPYYPSVYGVGYLGLATITGNKTQYDRWSNMISRCYNQKHEKYKTYGAVGVFVCSRWLSFENYLEDFPKIQGYDKSNLKNLAIDKDIKIKGNKEYSLEKCCFVTISENSKEMNQRVAQREFIAYSPCGETMTCNNQRVFAQQHNLDYRGLNAVLRGVQKTHRGWKFQYSKE